MPSDVVVLRADDQRGQSLADDGWTVTARSWAAQLDVTAENIETWETYLALFGPTDTHRALNEVDGPAVLALDAATTGDYPGSLATAHASLTAASAVPTAKRWGFGVFDADEQLVAMTFIEVDGNQAEVDFTVVARPRRRQGLATALKAASLLALARRGVSRVRTGGSAENRGILAANRSLGFRIDEHWITMAAPAT